MSAGIVAASTPAEIAACRDLFVAYQRALGVSLCFQNFDQEVAGLPGDYAPPRGGLWLAWMDEVPVGCVALRPLGASDAEMKRLYVSGAHRGHGLGRALARTAIGAAAALGYRALRLDTLPSMMEAQKLYEELGFVPIGPYNDNPIAGTRFLELDLTHAVSATTAHTGAPRFR